MSEERKSGIGIKLGTIVLIKSLTSILTAGVNGDDRDEMIYLKENDKLFGIITKRDEGADRNDFEFFSDESFWNLYRRTNTYYDVLLVTKKIVKIHCVFFKSEEHWIEIID
jgi:hypothetical protein